MGNPEPVLRLGPLVAKSTRAFGDGHREIVAVSTHGGGETERTKRGGATLRLVVWRSDGIELDWSDPFEVLTCLELDAWNGGFRGRVIAGRST